MKLFRFLAIALITLFIGSIILYGVPSVTQNNIETDFDTFVEMIANKDVQKVTITPTRLNAFTKTNNINTVYTTLNPHSDDMLNQVKNSDVVVIYDYSIYVILAIFLILIFSLIVVTIFDKYYNKNKILFETINDTHEKVSTNGVVLSPKYVKKLPYQPIYSNKSANNNQKSQNNNTQKAQPNNFNEANENNESEATRMTNLKNKQIKPAQIKVRFADVAGVDEAKVEVQEIVDFLKNPSKFTSFGVRVPRGLILYGQPGTGKTLLAKAIAGEAGVPFFSLSGSDFAEMYVGVGAARVRNLFKEARKNAPCIIFIDEIDALARKRASHSHSNEEKDQTLNQLLVEMDGFEDNSGIILIGATNRLDILDPAVLRPGRFDRHVEVPVPDKTGRFAILKIHARNKKLDKNINLMDVATKTSGFSGAELENVLNEAAVLALRKNQSFIKMQDIDEAISKVMVGLKKMKNNLSDKEKKIVAYHEAGHAITTKLLAKKVVEKITVLPTNKSLGYVMRGEDDESFLDSKEDLFNSICIALAGRAAEKIYFNENNITNGASNDLQKATNIAREMVFSYGMSSLGNISLTESFRDNGASISDSMKDKAYEEVQKILTEADEKVTKFIKSHATQMEVLVKALLEKETLYRQDVDNLLSKKNNNNKK
jgi:cell division protease FtsH